jgi:hypothetical protein
MSSSPGIEVRGASSDARLNSILDLVKQATTTLLDALQKTDLGLKFKAFTLKKFEGEHAEQQMGCLTDTIGAGIVMYLGQMDKTIVEKWSIELSNTINDDGDTEIWLYSKQKEISVE